MIYAHLYIQLFAFCALFFKVYNCLYVTDGSSIILENVGTQYKLFSTDMKWGTGSGNQLVTAVTTKKNDDTLLWMVKVYEEGKSLTGNKINCDEIVTLKHLTSNGYLAGSHHYSVLSNNFELSVNEDIESGKFQVICENKKNKLWKLGEGVYLKNLKQNGYLSTSKKYEFNQNNCRNCPILHHLEVCILAYNYPKDDQKWKARSGVIINHISDDQGDKYSDDEL
ncbi:dolichyl-phosphate-mannose protein mannosyltransferase, putative [Plasmodium ovale]|uniref:Dolichyl-phosphate-mannose protein mannosyltransferase, putative n=1 Tax=Plasmodium ovale TaxID=36330 RepID=A0A1C3KRB2_PLAOA|nr:dolichyl-phosphate-mannose protein mannosyltransferase, putative [Plasmodium ovale]